MCAGDGTSGEWGYSRLLESRECHNKSQVQDIELLGMGLVFLGPILFCNAPFPLFWKGVCLLYAIVYWNYINFIVNRLT